MGKPLPTPEKTNARGIPQAPFLGSVDDYASDTDEAGALLGQLQEMMRKYQFMELATKQRKSTLDSQIPNLRKTLETIEFLKAQKSPFKTQFELNDTLFAKASVEPLDTVWLWLGANVMLEYPLPEAQKMTAGKLVDAEKGSATCIEDLEFLRENITTMEVNTARVINWQVTKQKAA